MNDTRAKTIIHSNGTILFYKSEHFIKDIIQDGCCFICGAQPDSKNFNDEHIIPDWILKKHNLYQREITLPNGVKTSYSKYKVPCCAECNTELGNCYENPIRELLSKPYEEIAKELNSSQVKRELLFKWLSLIYFKTHLKDLSLRENLDFRKENKKIGDRYIWEDFHHIHCIVRSHHTNAVIEPEVYGSVYINEIILENGNTPFDYIDNPWTKGVFLQLGNIGISTILDDSTAAISMYNEQISIINQGISIFQFYEIFAHFNYIRLHLDERPVFYSRINRNFQYEIICKRPENLTLVEESERIGTHYDFLKIYCERSLNLIPEGQNILDKIDNLKWTFLWNEDGKFNDLKN